MFQRHVFMVSSRTASILTISILHFIVSKAKGHRGLKVQRRSHQVSCFSTHCKPIVFVGTLAIPISSNNNNKKHFLKNP
jgi:hypothetical protein